MAKATYDALEDAGANKEKAQAAAAETGEIYVKLESATARLNILIGIVIAGFVLVLGALFQIVQRLPVP